MSQRHDIWRRYDHCIHIAINAQMRRTPKSDYIARHVEAWGRAQFAHGPERFIRLGIESLVELAADYEARWDSLISADYVARDHFLDIARGLRGMLNFDIGKLDAGFCDAAICNICREAGFDNGEI